MPSRPLRRPPAPRANPARRAPALRFATAASPALLLAIGGLLACTSAGRAPAPVERGEFPGLAASERPFLVDPLAGYPLVAGGELQGRLTAAFVDLRQNLDLARVRAEAAEILAVDPGFHPAAVLAAQADFAAGAYQQVIDTLTPVAAELPAYTAAELVLGRAAELGGAPVVAFAAYWQASETSPAARERLAELKPRAVEIVVNRVRDALARGRLDEADDGLARLRTWAPGEAATLEVAGDVARAHGDRTAELQAISRLAVLRPEDRRLAERWGELELEAGDPGAGLALFERLATRYPGDREIAEKLDYAKFRWRLQLLPARVKGIAGGAEIRRGDFAVLLYWLAPAVRYGRPGTARIATDVLDDPRREEIVRVINLGLMDIDAGLHRFAPDAAASPCRRPAPAFTAGGRGGGRARRRLCRGDRGDGPPVHRPRLRRRRPLPADPVPRRLPAARLAVGGEALDLIRRGLDLTR